MEAASFHGRRNGANNILVPINAFKRLEYQPYNFRRTTIVLKRFLPTSQRSILVFAHDVVMTFVAFVVAMYLRVGEDFIYYSLDLRLTSASAMTIIAAAVFLFSGLYRGVWRYASLNDLLGIVRAVTIATLIFILIIFLWQRLTELPRSVPFINWFILITLLGGPGLYTAY